MWRNSRGVLSSRHSGEHPDSGKIGLAVGRSRRGGGKIRFAVRRSRDSGSWIVQPLRPERRSESNYDYG